MKTIHSYLFSDITATKNNFYMYWKHVFQRILLSGYWKLIFDLVEAVCFCLEPFFCCWKPWLKLEGINFNKIASGNHFRFFCQRKQFFCIVETYFSTNALFWVVETDFLANTNHIIFFRLVETYFLTNPYLQLLQRDFIFSGNRLLCLKVLSYWTKPSLIWVETIF